MSMNIIMLVVLVILTVIMSIQNFNRIKQYKKDKTYVDLYTKVLKSEENVGDELTKYIETETDPCLNTKARIVKAYNDILLEKNPSEDLKNIDIRNIYYENGKFSTEKAKLNSEIFVWVTLMLSKARCLSMIDLMNELYSRVEVIKDDLKILVEYQVFNATYNSLLEKGTDGIVFLKKLLNGDYGEYVYDKNLIGIYKKIACCLLVFTGEPIEKDDEAMLRDFTGTLVGNRFTRDLEIYDDYAPKTQELDGDDTSNTQAENKEEESQTTVSENNEVTEEPKQETEETPEAKDEEIQKEAEGINEDTIQASEKSDSEVKNLENVENEFINSIGNIEE